MLKERQTKDMRTTSTAKVKDSEDENENDDEDESVLGLLSAKCKPDASVPERSAGSAYAL